MVKHFCSTRLSSNKLHPRLKTSESAECHHSNYKTYTSKPAGIVLIVVGSRMSILVFFNTLSPTTPWLKYTWSQNSIVSKFIAKHLGVAQATKTPKVSNGLNMWTAAQLTISEVLSTEATSYWVAQLRDSKHMWFKCFIILKWITDWCSISKYYKLAIAKRKEPQTNSLKYIKSLNIAIQNIYGSSVPSYQNELQIGTAQANEYCKLLIAYREEPQF